MITISDIPGQTAAKRILLSSYDHSRLASTYLFYGADGLGKWPMATALAALVNCEKPKKDSDGKTIDSCGECRNCRQIGNLAFPELLFALPIPPHKGESEAIALNLEYLEEKKKEPYKIISSSRQLTIPIDTARDIKKKTAMMPTPGTHRVIIFYQMEKMLPSSADSLLKLIEEPPPGTIIILTANDPENLLPTIQSRAQKIPFHPLSASEIETYLKSKYDVADERAALTARLSEGSLGRALDLLEEEGEMSLRQTSFLILKTILTKDSPSGAAILNELINPNNRGEIERILHHWQSFFSDLIYLKYGADASRIVNIDLAAELEILASAVPAADDFCRILENIKRLSLSLRRNIHIRPAMAALAFKTRRHINQTP